MHFGWRDRGAKKRTNLYVLNHTRAVAVLIECCFVDSQSDAQKWDADKCARAIVQAVTGQAVSDSPSMPSAPSGSTYSGNSIVDYLKSVGKDSSFAARKQYAVQYGISGYTGTAAQNTQLLNAMRGGSGNSGGSSSGTGYYPAFSSTSIVDGLKSIGVDSSFSNRKKIANANGISNYSGTASQNNQLCTLAKKGRLKKA